MILIIFAAKAVATKRVMLEFFPIKVPKRRLFGIFIADSNSECRTTYPYGLRIFVLQNFKSYTYDFDFLDIAAKIKNVKKFDFFKILLQNWNRHGSLTNPVYPDFL